MAIRRCKRVVVMADLHCGHIVGLTPPNWQYRLLESDEEDVSKHNKWAKVEEATWIAYTEIMQSLQPIDVLIVNGDAIDGKGERSGSTECLTADRTAQTEMAAYCINRAKADAVVMTYGTAYHTGREEDWESFVFQLVKNAKKIGSHEWPIVNGVTFDCKHFASRSSIPHGKGTPLMRDVLWNTLWAERELQPKGDIIIRSHVHYAFYCGEPGSWWACTTPALQGMGSKYGARMCATMVHWGLISFDIEPNGEWRETWHVKAIVEQAAQPIVL
ncbi:MAG: hypothetical protein ABIK28_18195 [Planctomycetota bacterium]